MISTIVLMRHMDVIKIVIVLATGFEKHLTDTKIGYPSPFKPG